MIIVWVILVILIIWLITIVIRKTLLSIGLKYMTMNNLVILDNPFHLDTVQNMEDFQFSKNPVSSCLEWIRLCYIFSKQKDLIVPDSVVLLASFQEICYIFKNTAMNKLFIIFRGTLSIEDMISDLNNTQSIFHDNLYIHSGFLAIYMKMQKDLMDLLKTLSPSSVIIIGHSLGGALAMILSVDILTNMNWKPVLYTFGCPRVGDDNFVQFLKNKNLECYRVVNYEDVVPQFPLPVTLRMLNPRKPFFFEHYGTVIGFSQNLKSFQNNHSIFTYYQNFKENDL